MTISVDDSRWPLLVVRTRGNLGNDEFDAYMETMSSYLHRGELSALVMDVCATDPINAHQRKRQAQLIAELAPLIKKNSAGSAFVVDSRIVRGVLTAIFWVQPLPDEHRIFAKMEDAERWAIQQLARRGYHMLSAPTQSA